MFDAHNHLDDPRFDHDRNGAWQRARAAGVGGAVIAGYSEPRWNLASEIAASFPDELFAAYGVHPWVVAASDETSARTSLRALEVALDTATLQRPIGLGEFGVDRSRRCPPNTLARQEFAFRSQMALANAHELPIILHVVRAHDLVLAWLKRDPVSPAGGMVHGFTGSWESARAYLTLGLHISVGGAATSPNRKKLHRAIASIPEDRLLVETDAPDQPPYGHRGERNEPAHLIDVVSAVARIREVTPEHIGAVTEVNARRLFLSRLLLERCCKH